MENEEGVKVMFNDKESCSHGAITSIGSGKYACMFCKAVVRKEKRVVYNPHYLTIGGSIIPTEENVWRKEK